MFRIVLRIALAAFAVVGLMALAFFTLSGRLPAVEVEPIALDMHPPFRSWEEHDAIYRATEFPFIVEAGPVLFIGVQHSTDPEDAQWDVLRSRWAAHRPTVALNEGRSRYLRVGSSLVGGINDPKLAYDLARRDGIPIYSLEPSYQDEVDALLEGWAADFVATYFSLRVIVGEAGGDPERAEAIAPALIAKRTRAEGLRGTLDGVEALDLVWRREFPGGPDWRELKNLESLPKIRAIGDDSREVRGRHMVRALATLAGRGERVVAVVGASHAIRYEPTLRSLIGV